MKKANYYILKHIIPDFLLSILLILLFSVLNINVEILKSSYVLLFSLIHTTLVFFTRLILEKIQLIVIKRIPIQNILSGKQVIVVLLVFIFSNIILSILYFLLLTKMFDKFIVFEGILIPIIIGLIIEIIKIVFYKLMNFERMLENQVTQTQIDEKYQKMIEDILKDEEIDKIENQEDKQKEIHSRLEKIMTQMMEEKNNDENKDNKEE